MRSLLASLPWHCSPEQRSALRRLPSVLRRLASAALLALPALALAQGALTPPVATPAPSMKSLDQLEPRIPLQAGAPGVTVNANGGFTITAPGSYYLTRNLTVASGSGISIERSSVTLDLNGFTINSFADSAEGYGISIPSYYRGITIRHGRIHGTAIQSGGAFGGGGFQHGIYVAGAETTVEDVAVSNIRYYGIFATHIARCTAQVCGWDGLYAETVRDSRSTGCGSNAIYGQTVINCVGEAVGSTGHGIYAARLAANSSGSAPVGNGIEVHGAAENCTGISNTGIGLSASCAATNCYGFTASGSYALKIASDSAAPSPGAATNCVGDNGGAGIGLYADVASGCRGTSVSGIGLRVISSATGSTGTTVSGPYGIFANGAVESCKATVSSGTGTALSAETALNCKAVATGGTGIQCDTATNCTASTTGAGVGLNAKVATGCYATSVDNTALRVDDIAENCRGTTTGAGYGLYAGNNALNCIGTTNTGAYGLYAVDTAQNCTGAVLAGTGTALFAASASNCRGRANGGTGIQCETATGCSAKTTGNGIGIACMVATNCNATSVNGVALHADAAVANCRGVASGSGYGIYAKGAALSSYGATSSGSTGIMVWDGTTNTCMGGTDRTDQAASAIISNIMIGCSHDQRGILSTNNAYNMP